MPGVGTMNRYLRLQREPKVQDGYGELTAQTEWDTLCEFWARSSPVRGDERFAAQQRLAEADVTFDAQFEPATSCGIKRTDRIEDAETGMVYDIVDVQEVGYHEGLKILGRLRAGEAE